MLPETITDFQLFADGVGLMGKTPEVKLPALREIYEEEDLPGAGTAQRVYMDMMEKMESEFTLRGCDPATLGLFGKDEVLYTFRGALKQSNAASPGVAFVAHITGRLFDADMEGITRKSLTSFRCGIDVTHYKLIRDGKTLVEVAADGSVMKFGERDLRSWVNDAIGHTGGII